MRQQMRGHRSGDCAAMLPCFELRYLLFACAQADWRCTVSEQKIAQPETLGRGQKETEQPKIKKEKE